MIATLRNLPERVRGSLPRVAEKIQEVFAENIAAERGPDGAAWPATKDGCKALRGAAAKITYAIVGTTIVFALTAIEARHHFGWVKGGKQRQILPGDMADKKVIDAMWQEMKGVFDRAKKGIP
jgi:hypothetical protein